ncbi:MAG: response regulator [Verrucomicrobiota bacterium]|nr:response regulator [Verrucomicrobiota bacterium]
MKTAILIADDSDEDLFLLKRAFSRIGVQNPIYSVKNGREAIQYLKGEGVYSNREQYPFPGILLLDLHMPKADGFEVLRFVRNKLDQEGLLVVVLSRLDELKNIKTAYALGANSFLAKPGDAEELQSLIRTFSDYWLISNRNLDPTPRKLL